MDTVGLHFCWRCSTLFFAAIARGCWFGACGMLFGAGAIEECVTAGSTAAIVGEVTGTTLTP